MGAVVAAAGSAAGIVSPVPAVVEVVPFDTPPCPPQAASKLETTTPVHHTRRDMTRASVREWRAARGQRHHEAGTPTRARPSTFAGPGTGDRALPPARHRTRVAAGIVLVDEDRGMLLVGVCRA